MDEIKNEEPIVENTEEKVEEVQVEEVQIDPLVQQFDEMRNKYLRLSAEFDNYRKRTLKEKEDILKYSSETVLRDLLNVVDDFDIAIKNIETATDIDAVKAGVNIISNKFNTFLKSKGISKIDDIGQEFNTDLHDAITKIPVDNDEQRGKIVDVIKNGYMIHDKVIRHSKVIIGE